MGRVGLVYGTGWIPGPMVGGAVYNSVGGVVREGMIFVARLEVYSKAELPPIPQAECHFDSGDRKWRYCPHGLA